MSAVQERDEATTSGAALRVWRCTCCGKLLAKLRLLPGSTVEVKCRGCGTLNVTVVDKPEEGA